MFTFSTRFSTSLRRAARALGLLSVGALSTLGALSLTHVGPAYAAGPGTSLAALVAEVNALKTQQTADEAAITSQGNTITSLQTRIADVEGKTAPISVSGTDLTVTGVNVHLLNGMGAQTVNGLGNLIVGYNYSRAGLGVGPDVRTGSHNVVVGDFQNYSSYSGLLAGSVNTVSGVYASVSGGAYSTAGGENSSVSGGSSNTTSSIYDWAGGSYHTP